MANNQDDKAQPVKAVQICWKQGVGGFQCSFGSWTCFATHSHNVREKCTCRSYLTLLIRKIQLRVMGDVHCSFMPYECLSTHILVPFGGHFSPMYWMAQVQVSIENADDFEWFWVHCSWVCRCRWVSSVQVISGESECIAGEYAGAGENWVCRWS